MRERILAAGGTFHSGPTDAGGIAVEASFRWTQVPNTAERPPPKELSMTISVLPAGHQALPRGTSKPLPGSLADLPRQVNRLKNGA
jgi:hypothetical protein